MAYVWSAVQFDRLRTVMPTTLLVMSRHISRQLPKGYKEAA